MRTSRCTLRQVAIVLAAAATFAACGGGGSGGDRMLEVTGTDGLKFEPSRLAAAAGEVTVELISEPAVKHTFTIEELGDQEVVAAAAGATATGVVELEPGTYTFFCSVPGHRAAGMQGTLTVE